MACRTGCPTQDCGSYADCLKGMNIRVAFCGIGGGDATTQKKWDANIERYRTLRSQGVQPSGSKPGQLLAAEAISDRTGTAYKAK